MRYRFVGRAVALGAMLAAGAAGGTLCVTVQDELGLPLPGAAVGVVELAKNGARVEGTADAQGRYCSEVAGRLFSVEARARGYVSARFSPVEVAGRRTVVARLPVGHVMEGPMVGEATVVGVLRDGAGQAVRRRRICLRGGGEECQLTTERGEYGFVVAPGRYAVEVEGLVVREKELAVEAGRRYEEVIRVR